MAERDQPEKEDVHIRIDPQQQAGVWANFALVNHSEHEFTLDFVRLDYSSSPRQGIVVGRIAVSPLFITQLIAALQDNWNKYAEKAMPKEVYGDDDRESDSGD